MEFERDLSRLANLHAHGVKRRKWGLKGQVRTRQEGEEEWGGDLKSEAEEGAEMEGRPEET